MKKITFRRQVVLVVWMLLCGLSAQAADEDLITQQITINALEAGTLPQRISSSKKNLITNLKIIGEINGTDLRFIREMAGKDVKGFSTDGKLSILDLYNSIMAQMKLIPADNVKDKLWGRRGTPEREAMETKLKEDVNAYIVGEAIRKARLAHNLTQEQLGKRIGAQRAQISKLEKGTSVITLPTMSRVFQALGIATATLDLGIAGKIALW